MPYSLATGRYSGTQGISTAASATTLSDSTQVWGTNVYTGKTVQSFSAGFPTRGIITSNTTTVLTLNAGWDAGTPTSGQPYILSDLQPNIGSLYHVGFSNGTQFYGYMLEPSTDRSGGIHERSDIAAKQTLIQYASTNLIDRDFVYWPRVSQGAWSGGFEQAVFINPNQYFDGDLEAKNDGYLRLQSQWLRQAITTVGATSSGQITALNGIPYWTFREPAGNVYFFSSSLGSVTSFITSGAFQPLFIDSDGLYIYVAGAGLIDRYTNSGVLQNHVTTSINGASISQIWVLNQGTNGYFCYYSNAGNQLWKIDLTQVLPLAPASHAQVPFGGNPITPVDLCIYQNGIAILTVDVINNDTFSDVWYHDGVNTTLLVHLQGLVGRGICNALGNLFVTTQPSGTTLGTFPTFFFTNRGSVQLVRITSGSYDVAATVESPLDPSALQTTMQPRSVGRYVFWPVLTTPYKGVTTTGSFICRYNVITGALDHLPSGGANEFNTQNVRAIIATNETTVAQPIQQSATQAAIQYQSTLLGTITYQSTGTLVTSRYDLATPSVEKRFRRLEIVHAPLPTNCTITVKAFVDKDPVSFATATADATFTNNKVGTQATSFFLSNLLGHSVYFAITLTTSDNLNTPVINWYSTEVTTPLAWEFMLAAVNKNQLLDGQYDDQGVTPNDLTNFWRDAWSNPRRLTLFSYDGFAYTVALESFEIWSPSPKPQITESTVGRQQENFIHVVLRQTIADQ